MGREIAISIGQHSDKGRKETNQDFHGVLIPEPPTLGLKGIAIALADGISTSSVSRVAAEAAVKSFLTDYYCTSDSWSVKTSAQRVIAASNAWLHSQTLRSRNPYDKDKGYVCTLSVVVLKGATAHIFHIGDSRVYRVAGSGLEQLTEDHRITVSSQQSYLGRALGIGHQVEIDYRKVPLAKGDILVLATDGVYEHLTPRHLTRAIRENAGDLDTAARSIVTSALENGSADNLTIQIVRIDDLPEAEAADAVDTVMDLPLPPLPEPRAQFDGYRILRKLHASSRSHIYLAVDTEDDSKVVLKLPSIDLREDKAYLRRFMLEEWVARRIDSAHVLKPRTRTRPKSYVYIAMEYIEGQTLTQWMIDNPKPHIETVREIVEQIAKGLRAFHRREMLHQDLRPENIMIDRAGVVKIIDFGSVRVAGVAETRPRPEGEEILGTAQYTAPEYFTGGAATNRSDIFSLGVIAYQMLTGQLPYGAGIARARTSGQMRKLKYRPARTINQDVPIWIDGALQRAVRLDPNQRYEVLSEFLQDLRQPNSKFLDAHSQPLIERHPVRFWQSVSVLLLVINIALLFLLIR